MKAALLSKWEDLAMIDISEPQLKEGQALIKVVYAGVCGSDITVYKGLHPTATVPVVVGHEIYGIVEDIKPSAKCNFKRGDRVTVYPLISCGVCDACERGYKHVCRSLKLLGIHENGGYAEYTVADIDSLVKIPEVVSDKAATLSEPFAVGFHVIKRSELQIGDTALIIGSGPIGLIIALAAKEAGASKILISEINEKRAELASYFGFETINPTKVDVKAALDEYTNGQGFDVVFEVSGSQAGALLTVDACKVRGTIVPLSLSGSPINFPLGKVSFKEIKVVGSRVYSYTDFKGGVRLLEKLIKHYDIEKIISDEIALCDAQKAINDMIGANNCGKIIIKC